MVNVTHFCRCSKTEILFTYQNHCETRLSELLKQSYFEINLDLNGPLFWSVFADVLRKIRFIFRDAGTVTLSVMRGVLQLLWL